MKKKNLEEDGVDNIYQPVKKRILDKIDVHIHQNKKDRTVQN